MTDFPVIYTCGSGINCMVRINHHTGPGLRPDPRKDTETVRHLYEFECAECGATNDRLQEFEPSSPSVVHCDDCGEMTSQRSCGRK